MNWALLLTLARFSSPPAALPPVGDRWFGIDKAKHFAASAVVQGVGFGIAADRNRYGAAQRVALGAVVVVGLAREVYDWRVKKHFSKKDLAWDLIGGAAAALAIHATR